MRIYRITTRHSQLTDVSTPHSQSDISGVGFQVAYILGYSYDSIGQGTWTAWTNTNQAYRGFYNNSKNNGDNISYKVYLAKGTYTLLFLTATSIDRGIAQILLDGTEIASWDLYSDSMINNVLKTQTGINISSDGIKTLTLKVNGKNPSSDNYIVSFSYIALIRIT